MKVATSSDSIISPGEFAVICQDDDVFLRDYPSFIGSVFDSSWTSLSEDGEDVGLKDSSGNFVEQFSYVATTKYSLERKNPFSNIYNLENWQENNNGNTVGFQNSNYFVFDNLVSSTVTSSLESSSTLEFVTTSESLIAWDFIKLNEIVSDPVIGNEIVELYNNGSSTVDVSGGLICDSSGENCKTLSGIINGHDWLIADLLTDRYLNNSGDGIVFKDNNKINIDQIIYGVDGLSAPEKGQSLSRKQDGVDSDSNTDWTVTNKITLGSLNEIILPQIINNGGGNNTDIGESLNSTSVVATTKSNKTTTTSKKISEPKDPVNISWKLDWPYGLSVGEVGTFSSRGSADPRGGEVTYNWNFGDNSSSTGDYVPHLFVTSGVYIVSVSASSSAGTYGEKEFKVHVGPNFSVALSNIKIDEYLVTSTDDLLEYITLKNFLDKPQNISGWKLKNKSGKEYKMPDNTIISASGTLKFFRTIHHLSFDKDGDSIILTSPNDREIHKVMLFAEKKNSKKETKISSVRTTSSWLIVRGVVTVEPKIFGQQYFYISDGQTGYQIYQYKKDFPDLKNGDYLSVSGEVSEIAGVKRIKIKNKFSIDVLSTNKIVEPVNLSLEDIDENYLGMLVKIDGDVTEIKSNLMYVDDGSTEIAIYFKKGAKIDKQDMKEGDKIEVIGILNKNKDGWQVLPRSLSDIKIVGSVESVIASHILSDQEKQAAENNKYVATTISGVGALLIGFLARARGALLVGVVKKVATTASRFVGRG